MPRFALFAGVAVALAALPATLTLAWAGCPTPAAQPAPPTLPAVRQARFKADTFNIQKYGAIANGQTLNTQAFQKAIVACALGGGGTVLVPAGLWLTGPIVLQNHVNLHLATGALVQFTADHRQYPLIKTTWEGEDAIRSQAPISGVGLTNIAVTGNGTFDGAGDSWRPVKKSKLNEGE